MSKSQSRIPSPARSQGAITPQRRRTRRTLSVASPARSDASIRLSSVVDKFINNDKFTMSPLKRRSVLPDDTEIEVPTRASWWKRLEGSSRDVLEALDTNKMPDDLLMEEYEFEVEKDKQNQTVPESSDNESVASIIVPQRRLFNQKKQPQAKFGEIIGSRKSLGRTNIEDVSIDDAPKNLFNKGPRNKPVFPAALLNSTNKTINKTVEPEINKQSRPNLFGQAGTKRKNMFTDFVLSESEEDSEVHHKEVFSFKNKRMSLGTRNRRMPSLTPSMTTEIDIDDWNLLPSSTMIGAPDVSRIITDKDIEFAQEENQDKTLTEEDPSLNLEKTDTVNKTKNIQNKSQHNEDNDKTLTNENIETEDANKHLDIKENNVSKQINTTNNLSKSARVEDKTLQNKSSRGTNNENIIGNIAEKQELGDIVTNHQLVENEPSVEEAMAELHGEIIEKDTSQRKSPPKAQNLQNFNNSKNKNNEDIENMHERDKSEKIISSPEVQKIQNRSKQTEKDTNEKEMELNNIEQENQDNSKEASQEIQNKDRGDTSAKYTSNQDKELNAEEVDRDEEMGDISLKDKSESELEPSTEEQEIADSCKEVTQENENVDMNDQEEDKREEEAELSAEEQVDDLSSKEASQENEDEDMNDISEKDISEKDVEPSTEEQDIQDISKEVSQDNQDEDMDDTSEKDRESDQEMEQDLESQNSSKEKSSENQDEDMEEMVWDDNDDEKSSDHAETEENGKHEKSRKLSSHGSLSKNISSKSLKTVGLSVREDQMELENDVIDETPNNSTHDTTGRNRKNETSQVKSPEAVLQNISKDNESFRPIGRSTTFRKSKSVIFDNKNVRPSLPPVQESTLGSEGSRNSSTEGSEWDSHRTTRKTIRQTFGKGFTPRKSLRALVMEQSAKRQTEHYNKANMTKNKSVIADSNDKNASKLSKTKNKTVVYDAHEKDASKMNNTKNKTAVDDVKEKDASKMNKTKNKTVIEDINERNAATINKTKNMSVLQDVNDLHIRDRRVSNHNISSNQLSESKSPVHGTFTHHVSDPLISEPQVTYHESLQNTNEPEMSEQQISDRDASINISEQANNDSGPEISIHASYGQSMSAEYSDRKSEYHAPSDLEISDKVNRSNKEILQRVASVHKKSMHVTSEEEILDYEASNQEQFEEEMSEPEEVEDDHSSQENAEDNSDQELLEQSVQEEEKEDSEPEESENKVEPEEENESQEEESESEQEELQETDAEPVHESENEDDMSQESVNDASQRESDQESVRDISEESEQEASDKEENYEEDLAEPVHESVNEDDMSQESVNDASQRESDQESVRDISEESEQEASDKEENYEEDLAEPVHESVNEDDMSQESVNDASQRESDQESVQDISEEPEQEASDKEENDEEDSDHFVSGLNSPHEMSNRTERVVFDNEMSEQEINYELSERVSRQMTDNDISDQVSEREPTPNLTRSRVSEHCETPDVSVGTRKTMLLMQMERIAQQNKEIRQKISEKVQNSLKRTRNFNMMSPIKSNFSIRRINKPEPKKARSKPKPTGIPAEALPKEFVEDLKYKPPKRFAPANAPWITKRLYKFLETKLEPKYDYRARVRSEELVQSLHSFAKLVRRRDVAPPPAVAELKREMARLHVVNTHFEFYEFFHEFMPREIRIKVNPDVVNKIPMPRNGVFAEILESRSAVA